MMEHKTEGEKRKKKKNWFKEMCVLGFICIQTAILLILLVELYGDPFISYLPLFFAPVFSFLYHFSTSVCLWLGPSLFFARYKNRRDFMSILASSGDSERSGPLFPLLLLRKQ